jgi:putative endonuclease
MSSKSTTAIGRIAERRVVAYLVLQGFELLHSNWRYGPYELDAIIKKGDTTVFLEVKYRKNSSSSILDELISKNKLRHLRSAIRGWLQEATEYANIRIMVAFITEDNRCRMYWVDD